MFTISVCMIVKNEEDCLARILKQAQKFADEIVIVDTGSTDTTKQIAQKFTDKVFDFKWTYNFAEARNFAFSKGKSDFLMWLDADDVITQENVLKIVNLKNKTVLESAPDVYMFKYCTGFDKQNNPSLTYFRERLLKRSKGFVWQGFVHEAIAPSGQIEYTDIEIHHKKTHSSDPNRNLKLYQNSIKNGHVLNTRETYYFAREHFYNGHYNSCIKHLRKFLKMPLQYPPDVLGAHLMLADCHAILGKTDIAISTLLSYLNMHVATSELCCKLANLFEKSALNGCGKENSIFWYKAALDCPPQTEGFVNGDFQEFLPCLELSRLLFNLNYAEAKKYHQRAKLLKPKHPSVIFNQQFFND